MDYANMAARALGLVNEREGMGCGCRRGAGPVTQRGMAGAGDVSPTAGRDRKAGLTFGELQQIGDWLRNYLLPPLGRTGVANWYPESLHYRQLAAAFDAARFSAPPPAVNEYGESARAAWERVQQRWAQLQLVGKDELQPVYALLADVNSQARYGTWPAQKVDINPQRLLDKIVIQVGLDAWYRFVGAMAIGRDLFAEAFSEIGGVQPGLGDTVEELLESGVAVTGEWQNLAGRWIWKGYDLHGTPIYDSQPLFDQPRVLPEQWDQTVKRNRSVFRWLMSILPSQQTAGAAAQAVPTLVNTLNQVGRLKRGFRPVGSVPATGQAMGELLADLFEILGVDVVDVLGAVGEDFADQADLKFPWRPGSTIDPLPQRPADPSAEPGVYAGGTKNFNENPSAVPAEIRAGFSG